MGLNAYTKQYCLGNVTYNGSYPCISMGLNEDSKQYCLGNVTYNGTHINGIE